MKKFAIIILSILIAGLFVACNQDVTVDAQIHDATHGHTDITYFSIQSDGSWKCKYCDYILPGTESPYITVLNDGYPTEIIPLTSTTYVGYGTVTIEGDSVTYSNASGNGQDVVIRTNGAGTVLTVDAEHDTVAHYGEAGFLNVIKVNTASYHEHGYIPQAQIAQGRIVNEAGSVETEDGTTKKAGVENLFIVAATEGGGSTAGTFSDVIVEAAQGAEVPALDRSDVNIVGSVLVVEVKTPSSDDFVYLTRSGIVEQVVVTTEKGNTDTAGAKATTGNDSSLNATASKAADEIANIAKRNAQGQVLAADGTTPIEDISTITSVEQIAIAEPKATKADLEKSQGENALFAGGAGTENNPYLIANATHFQNVVSGTSSAKKYYQLINDIDLSATGTDEGSGIVSLFEYAVLNGANHQIAVNNSEYYLFSTVLYSTISDVNVVELKYPMVKYANFSTFNDVDTIGKINCADQNLGIYVIYAKTKDQKEVTLAELTYIDCDCGVDFSSEGGKYNGVFTGYARPNKTTELTYTNCTYNATFVSGKAAMFLGNNSANSGYVTINVNNCENCGIIRSTDTNYTWNSYVATGISSNASNPSFTNNTVILNGVKLTADNICEPMGYGFVQGPNDANLKLVQNSDGTFTVTASENTNVSYYVVSVGLYSYLNVGGTLVQQVREKIETSAFNNKTFTTALKNLSFVDKAWVEANSSATAETVGEGEYAYTVYTLNGIQYYYLPNVEKANVGGQPKAPQMIVVSCYDANGDLITSAQK